MCWGRLRLTQPLSPRMGAVRALLLTTKPLAWLCGRAHDGAWLAPPQSLSQQRRGALQCVLLKTRRLLRRPAVIPAVTSTGWGRGALIAGRTRSRSGSGAGQRGGVAAGSAPLRLRHSAVRPRPAGSGPRYQILKRVQFSHVRVFSDSRNVQKSVTQIIYLGPLPRDQRSPDRSQPRAPNWTGMSGRPRTHTRNATEWGP